MYLEVLAEGRRLRRLAQGAERVGGRRAGARGAAARGTALMCPSKISHKAAPRASCRGGEATPTSRPVEGNAALSPAAILNLRVMLARALRIGVLRTTPSSRCASSVSAAPSSRFASSLSAACRPLLPRPALGRAPHQQKRWRPNPWGRREAPSKPPEPRGFFEPEAPKGAFWKAIAQYEELQRAFPRSTFVKCELAVAQYNLREFDEAQHAFEQLLHDDPCRLDHVDTCDATLQTGGITTPRGPCQISISPALGRYSNILYVKESKRELSALAHRCVGIDRYRPESCCVIGNYYSLRGEHEKAVMAFRRALKVRPTLHCALRRTPTGGASPRS